MNLFKALNWFTKKLDFVQYCTRTVTALQSAVSLLTEELNTIWKPYLKDKKIIKNEVIKKTIVSNTASDSIVSDITQKVIEDEQEIT